MAKDNSSLIFLLAGGAVAWYGYTQGWFSSIFGGVTTNLGSPGNTTAPAPVCAAPNVLVNGVCTAPAVTQGSNPPTGTAPLPPPPAPITTPPAPPISGMSTAQAIAATALAAQAANEGLPNALTAMLNADQWNYYWGHVPNFVPNANFDATFFPNGRPANNSNYTQYTANQYVVAADAGGMGMSGFGNVGYARRIPVPMLVRPAYGRGHHYTLADLRRAGRR